MDQGARKMTWSARRIAIPWAIAFGLGCGPEGPVLTLNPTGADSGGSDATSPNDDATVGNSGDATPDAGSPGSADSASMDAAAPNMPDDAHDANADADGDAEGDAGMDPGSTGCGQRPSLPPDASP